jgi:hypothetical protein
MPIEVTVRDAESVLTVFESPRPLDVGELLDLPDGSSGRIKQTIERSDAAGVRQLVTVVDS